MLSVVMATFIFSNKATAQANTTYMRVAKIVVDSTQLESYKTALKEQIQAAVKLEKGVLAYSAVQDKNNPEHITILETYASVTAYESHIQTEHFKSIKLPYQIWLNPLNLLTLFLLL